MIDDLQIARAFLADARACIYEGDCRDFLRSIPDGSVQLVVTSPPYNIGKEYERRISLDRYAEQQGQVITECWRVLRDGGHICWQVGNFLDSGTIVPLDTLLFPVFRRLGMKMRNRIVWQRARFTLREPLLRPVRDHQLVYEGRSLFLQSRPCTRPTEIPR